MADGDPNPREQQQQNVPPATDVEPQWAVNLRNLIEGLPNRIGVNLTDDDKNQIGDRAAERTYGLFDQGGAFHREQEQQSEQHQQESEQRQADKRTEGDTPPKKKRWGSFASMFGD